MELSIIVPVYNIPAELRTCLAALSASVPSDCEIIVVDDGSSLAIEPVAREFNVEYIRLEQNSGDAVARNVGVRAAKGSAVLFVDADVAVHDDTITRLLRVLRGQPGLAAVFGSYDSSPTAPGLVSQYRNILHHHTHQRANPDASTFWTGFGAIRKNIFENLGGFQEVGRQHMGDVELGYRLRDAGHSILLDKKLLVTHLKRWTLPLMVRTDLFLRAIPWSRMIIGRAGVPADLNIDPGQKVSVALTGVAIGALLLSAFGRAFLVLSLVAVAIVVLLNRDLFAVMNEKHGKAFAMSCIPIHLLHLAIGGVGYSIALLESLLPARHAKS